MYNVICPCLGVQSNKGSEATPTKAHKEGDNLDQEVSNDKPPPVPTVHAQCLQEEMIIGFRMDIHPNTL